jgi:hypothetical protein
MADSAVYQAEKTMKDNEWKFDAKLWDEAKEKIESLKKVLANLDVSKEEIDTQASALQEIMMKIWQEIYSKWQAEAPKEDDGVKVKDNNEKKEDENTVEGEVE